MLLLAPPVSKAQMMRISTFTGASGASATSGFRLATGGGESLAGQTLSTDRSNNVEFWYAELALVETSNAATDSSLNLPRGVPDVLSRKPNYPNPASIETNLLFGLPESDDTSIAQSATGGFKFPDGTLQTSAAVSRATISSTSGSNIDYSSGNVGIGDATLQATLTVATATSCKLTVRR